MPGVPVTGMLRQGDSDTRMLEIFNEYYAATADEAADKIKERLSALSLYAQSQGLTGQAALDGLRSLCSQLKAELLDTRICKNLYGFVYFMCRERGQRSVAVSTAIEAWKLSLRGRFRLLDQWCEFVQVHHRHAISEDTWLQVLEFSHSVPEDLSDYDPAGSWASLIDEFVDKYRAIARQAGSKRRQKDPHEEAALANSISCLYQRLGGMHSPLSTKRLRTTGNSSEASDPMEDVDGDAHEGHGI